MIVNCKIIRQVFNDIMSEFRVLSCIPIGENPKELKLNNYGNFTISGSNLSGLKIGQEISLEIKEDSKSKYDGSYVLINLAGFNFDNKKIEVERNQEFPILSGMMEESQAKHVLEAYPDFIQMILNGQEKEIDYKNIYNVGEYRLNQYIDKVKSSCNSILFTPVSYEYGVEDYKIIQKFSQFYNSPEQLKESFQVNPYHVYIDQAEYSFDKADKLVLIKFPNMIDSFERCKYGCLEILKENESEGDTRLNANLLASLAKELIPETMNHIVEVVKNCDLFHFNEGNKYSSIQSTYQAEQNICNNLQNRLKNPVVTEMNWEDFIEVDGFTLSEQQQEILKVMQNNSVAILTGYAGCGKSSSMKALIRMLEAHGRSYTMLCPTGTAAKVLSKATGRYASTIHMFLATQAECGEFLILEESSMVGVELLSKLLDAVPESTKLLFICDPSQLPSISCGNVVHDILTSKKVPNVNLTKIFRYNSSGLITVATDTRMGNSNSFSNQYEDYNYVEESSNVVKQILEIYSNLLSQGYNKNEILILSPYNKGKAGTYIINEAIQENFNKHDFLDVSCKRNSTTIRFKVGDKVINKKNNYKIPRLDPTEDGYEKNGNLMFVANGSIGTIISSYYENDKICFAVQFEDGIGAFEGNDIKNLLLGYAISIHASQGNQSKAVIVVISNGHKRMINRNLLYVAFTRAQEKLVVIGDNDTITDGMQIEETILRDTWLGDMLKEESNVLFN